MKQAKPVGVLVLQRNLPQASDEIVELLRSKFENDKICDFYVVESGSDEDKRSKYCSFWANWPEATEKGLHYCRGMNFGLSELHRAGKEYEYYLMVMGDTKFDPEKCDVRLLVDLMKKQPTLGILSPRSSKWGDDIPDCEFCLHHLVPHVVWLMRHDFLETIIDVTEPRYMNYFYDGSNLRGYDTDTLCIWQAYQHGYCLGVTNVVRFIEDHKLMSDNWDKIKTERVELHRKMMYDEGLAWMKQRFGFENKQQMRKAVLGSMQKFLDAHPEMVPFARLTYG